MEIYDDVVVGRAPGDTKKWGTRGAVLLGKKWVEQNDKLNLGPNIYLDVTDAHAFFLCGKRGGGKSYTMGVIAEGFALLEPAIKNNLSIILLDTMGVYWSMTHPNHKEKKLLEPYNLYPMGIDVTIFTPEKFYYEYKKKGIPTSKPFSLNPADLEVEDWCKAFRMDQYDDGGLLVSDIIATLREKSPGKFTVEEMIDAAKEADADDHTKSMVAHMFKMATTWGLFGETSTGITELAQGGQVAVLDVSCYATMPGGWDVKALVVGLVAKHLFLHRMAVRKSEEFESIKHVEEYFEGANMNVAKQDYPLVWLVIDEAHEFLPKEGETAASEPLVTILREGRQPGISLILATQQPGKIHSDVLTQSDTVISHRITAQLDVKALSVLAQSYMEEGLIRAMNYLPALKGCAVVFDDKNEKIHQIRVRPRFTWHGGASPNAIKEL